MENPVEGDYFTYQRPGRDETTDWIRFRRVTRYRATSRRVDYVPKTRRILSGRLTGTPRDDPGRPFPKVYTRARAREQFPR